MKKHSYPRIPDSDYKKAVFQMRGQYMAVLNCFRCYGMDILVDGAINECVEIAEQFSMRTRGKDQIIKVRESPAPRPTE